VPIDSPLPVHYAARTGRACPYPRRDPDALLLNVVSTSSERRVRLFACACCWSVWELLPRDVRAVFADIERYSDGPPNAAGLEQAHRTAWDLARGLPGDTAAAVRAIEAMASCAGPTRGVAQRTAAMVEGALRLQAQEHDAVAWDIAERLRTMQEALVRDVFGNPLRPTPAIDPAWLAWNAGTVRSLAECAYTEPMLREGTLEPSGLALLADALEDAGCTDAELLGHLKGAGAACTRDKRQ
jgi:hypothetical protein